MNRTFENLDVTPDNIEERILACDKLNGKLTEKQLGMFADYASRKNELDLKGGISKLIDEYIENCGISVSNRTVYYDAAQALLELFIVTDDPLAVSLRKEGKGNFLIDIMQRFNPDFTDDLREYDNRFAY